MTRRTRFGLLGLVICAALFGAGFAADRLFPPDLSRLRPSQIVEDRHGAMLRAFQTPDQQWRLATGPADVSDAYLRMLVDIEDKRFWHHCGFDPIALARALGQLVTHGHIVSGGSTLTMQVVRLLEPRPRTLRSKLIEIARAVQLEARMSKTDILRAYLTLTPLGGNLEGVRAGSLAWFGKEPRILSDAEAALLVALPQAPRRNRPDKHPMAAEMARAKILAMARRDGLLDASAQRSALAAPLPKTRRDLPQRAPHLAERLVKNELSSMVPIRTAIDIETQIAIERILRQALDDLPRPVNLAAIVADWHTGEILARVGSGAYYDEKRDGMIDMSGALRSPGSTLKPFIYGMAFEGLLAHPKSLVRDEPTRFDDYAPHNFDGGFNGDVTVRQALQASLNLPAVIMLQKLGPIAFAGRFKQVGLPLTFTDDSVAPSLPMALGGVGTTLEQLVTAYAALADGGVVKPLVERTDQSVSGVRGRIMSRAAADAIVDIISDMPPPRGLATHAGRVAYKTGTSYRFRDGWAIGFDESRVIGVWMGRADGGTCVTCVGVASAAILFRLFDTFSPDPIVPRVLVPVFAGAPPPALARLALEPTSAHRISEPRIAFPLSGAHLLVDAGSPAVRLAVDGGRRPYRWIVDGQAVESRDFARETAWHPDGQGFATITVVDALGHSDEIKVRVVPRTSDHD
jgi:penicillin-binding protein 1C